MAKRPNGVPLSVTEERINRLPVDVEQNRVNAPGPAGDRNRCPIDPSDFKKK